MLRKTLLLALAIGALGGAARAADATSVDADGTVSIRPGEAFEIVFPDRSDLSHPKFSRALDRIDDNVTGYKKADPSAPPPTGPALMSFEFNNTGSMLMLYIRNDTGLPLKYSATMVVQTAGAERSMHTSICPIFPGMMGTEQWMDHIVVLKLSGFRKADDTGSFVCD
jgi:hypothetical protein